MGAQKGEVGLGLVTNKHPGFVCIPSMSHLLCLSTQPPPPLFPPPDDIQILPFSDPDNSSFWNIFLGRITTVFSLVLPSYDQSIAQEMGSSESCLSKISRFTSWNILREHSAPSLPEGKYFTYLCIKRPHILLQ